MKKKILSIVLAFTFAVQPAYLVAQQQPTQQKKGIVARVQEKFAGMQEAMSNGRAALKNNFKCLTTGKGPNCNPDRLLALKVISSFVKGDMQATRENMRKLFSKHWYCWKKVLIAVGIPLAVIATIMVGVVAVAADPQGTLPWIESGAEGAFRIGEIAYQEHARVEAAERSRAREQEAYERGLTDAGQPVPPKPPVPPKRQEQPAEKTTIRQKLQTVGSCIVTMGVDVAIVAAIVAIIVVMVQKKEERRTKLFSVTTVEEVGQAIKDGADINAINENEQTPLHIAARENSDVAQALIRAGADVKATDRWGRTPLHWVYNSEVARALIRRGADVNAKDVRRGQTPLHLAYNLEVARALIENGANVNEKDLWDKTPKDTNEFVAKALKETQK